MKKTVVVLGLGVLLFGLSLGQVSGAQMTSTMSMATSPSPEALQQDIQLLKVIDQTALTQGQLVQLQTLLSELREAQQNVVTDQQALKTFLLSWQGKAEAFQAALVPFETKIQQTKLARKQVGQRAIVQLKDQLSYRQGETFFTGLNDMTSSPMQMSANNMMQAMMEHMQQTDATSLQGMMSKNSGMKMDGQARTQQNMTGTMQAMKGQMSQMGSMMGDWERSLNKHADGLIRVVSEKLANLGA